MKKLMLGLVLAALVSVELNAQTAAPNPAPAAPAVQPATTVKPASPQVQPAPPAVQPAATVMPQPKPTIAAPSTAPTKQQPAQPAQKQTVQPAQKQPEKAKVDKSKATAKAEGPMDWGTDYWHGTARFNWWDADYSSKFKFVQDVSGTPQGMTIDMKKMLNLNTPASVWEIEVWGRPSKRNRIFGSYMFSQYTGKVNVLNEKIEAGDKTFNVDVDVRTKLMNNRATLNYQYMPWANNRGGIGPFLGVEFYQYSLELSSNAEDKKFRQSLNVPVPVIGLEGDYLIGYGLGLWGKVAGVGASFQDIYASYFDVEAGLQFKWKLLMAGVGYRWLTYDIEAGKKNKDGYLKIDTDQTGVLATVGINF